MRLCSPSFHRPKSPPLPRRFADAYARRYPIALVLFPFHGSTFRKPSHRFTDLIYRSFAITLFLVRFSCRKKARETREKCYFDCESLSFFFTMFFVRLTSIICSIIVKIVRLSSRFVWTENEINAAFLERKYPGFEVIVSSKTNIRERERNLYFEICSSRFSFFSSSFSLSLSLSLFLSPSTVYSAMNFDEARRNDVARESSLPLVTMG